jgi:DNA repair exonuclease SbcCD nuclease subunit
MSELVGVTDSGESPKNVSNDVDQKVTESTSTKPDAGEMIYEAKKLRSRAQTAESERDQLKAELEKLREAQLVEQENYKQLADERGAKLKELELSVNEKSSIVDSFMNNLRSQLSDEDRELVADVKDPEKLQKFVDRFGKNSKLNIGTDDARPGAFTKFDKDIWDMSAEDRKSNWNEYLRSLVRRD